MIDFSFNACCPGLRGFEFSPAGLRRRMYPQFQKIRGGPGFLVRLQLPP